MVYGEFALKTTSDLAKEVINLLPKNHESIYFTNSGPEAIEAAIKLVKNATKKSKIIALKYIGENSYLHLDILSKHVQKHIHIKVPGKFIPPKNKICYINIGKKNFFVF